MGKELEDKLYVANYGKRQAASMHMEHAALTARPDLGSVDMNEMLFQQKMKRLEEQHRRQNFQHFLQHDFATQGSPIRKNARAMMEADVAQYKALKQQMAQEISDYRDNRKSQKKLEDLG